MPLLFLFLLVLSVKKTVILTVSTALGVKRGIDARNNHKQIKMIARNTENDLEEARKKLEYTITTIDKTLADLAKIRQFVDIVEEIHSTKHNLIKYGKINVNFEMPILWEIKMTSCQNQNVLKNDFGTTDLASALGVDGKNIAITGLRCCGNQCSFSMVWVGR